MDRQPQLYDTLSKKGVFYRVIKVEDNIITAKRLKGDTNGKQGRPVTGSWEEIQTRGYRLCDIPPVTVYKINQDDRDGQKEPIEPEEETAEETQEGESDPAPEEVVEVCQVPEESEERCKEVRHVSNAVLITGMICLTMIVLALIDKE